MLSSDPLSSVAYATEEILRVLAIGGVAALSLVTPIGAVIAAMLAIVVFSYRQTIYAYPNGGGAYIVAKDNLGRLPSLIAAAALLIDYVLTVVGQHRRGRGRDHVGVPGVALEHGRGVAGVRRDSDARQPARRPRIGPAVCRAHLLLHRQHSRDARASAPGGI